MGSKTSKNAMAMSHTSGFSMFKSLETENMCHKKMIKLELDNILNECKDVRGNSKNEISEVLGRLTTKVGVD